MLSNTLYTNFIFLNNFNKKFIIKIYRFLFKFNLYKLIKMSLNVQLSRRITLDGLDPIIATRNLIKWIKTSKCKCTFECASAASIVWNYKNYPKILKSSVKSYIRDKKAVY